MTSSPSHDRPVDDESRYPSVGVRTVVSLVLFVHLFALAVAMSSTRMTLSSPLETQLRNVPLLTEYLQLLWMDLNYDYQHTNGQVINPQNRQRMHVSPQMDYDHYLEIDLQMPDGSQKTVTIPQSKFPRQRYVREQELADAVVQRVGDTNNEGRLPGAITRYWMEKTGATSAKFRALQQVPLAPEILIERSDDPGVRDPEDERYFQTVLRYAASLTQDNAFNFMKVESTRDAAPAAAGDSPQ